MIAGVLVRSRLVAWLAVRGAGRQPGLARLRATALRRTPSHLRTWSDDRPADALRTRGLRCGIAVDPAFTAARLQHADATVEEVRIPLQAPDDIIVRIHHERCHAQRLASAVGVSLGDFTTVEVDGRTVVQTTLTLARGSSPEDISVSELRGSVVFDVILAEDGEPPTMPAGEDQLEVPLIVQHTARGCDAHVLGETKQPFLFPFFLTFGGGDPQYGTFDVSPVQREVLWEYIRTVCPEG